MSRIKNKFSQLSKEKRKALVTFISSCDPNLECSQEILNALPSYGSDIIEIGLPFSDPMADGPTIQKSSQRGIKSGFTVNKTFKMVNNFRVNDKTTPIIFMGYFNTLFQFGLKSFFSKSKENGVDGVIIVDLPPEEEGLINKFLKEYKISIIRLITPTTSEKRLKTILKSASGFLYYVSIMGITGTKIPSLKKVRKAVSVIKKNTEIPVVVGFGINNSSQILEISNFADGSVVGSSIVKIIEDAYEKKKSNKFILKKLKNFLNCLKNVHHTNLELKH